MRFVDCTGSFSYLKLSTDNWVQINILGSLYFFFKSYLYENRELFSWLHLQYGPLIIKINFIKIFFWNFQK